MFAHLVSSLEPLLLLGPRDVYSSRVFSLVENFLASSPPPSEASAARLAVLLQRGEYKQIINNSSVLARLIAPASSPDCRNDDALALFKSRVSSLFASGPSGPSLSSSSSSSPASPCELFELFLVGISSLYLFLQNNFTGPLLSFDEDFPCLASSLLAGLDFSFLLGLFSIDGEDFHQSASFQSIFLLAHFILFEHSDSLQFVFSSPSSFSSFPWWNYRFCEVFRHCLDHRVESLKSRSEGLIKRIKQNSSFLAVLDDEELQHENSSVFSPPSDFPSPSTGFFAPPSPPADFPHPEYFLLLNELFLLEISQTQQFYWKTEFSYRNIELAMKMMNFSIEYRGILGNRTKYQVEKKAQLIVETKRKNQGKEENGPSGKISHSEAGERKSLEEGKSSEAQAEEEEEDDCNLPSQMPIDHNLNSDVLLDQLSLDDEPVSDFLSIPQRALLLAHFHYFHQNQPVNHTAQQQQLLAILYRILEDSKNPRRSSARSWLIEAFCLFHRSLLEAKDFHKQDRALLQLEELGKITQIRHQIPDYSLKQKEIQSTAAMAEETTGTAAIIQSNPMRSSASASNSPSVARIRLCDYFYSSSWPSNWSLKHSIGQLFESMKFHKSALQLYEEILYWDGIIELSILLGRNARAEEFLHQQIELYGEMPKFLCLLGDLKENPDYYEKAWEKSQSSYPRAQRALGKLKRQQGKFAEAIKHYQLALSINPVFPDQWFALGFCCLETKNFELAATAFARTIALDPEYSDAWNNLAVAHLSLKAYRPAFNALENALKCSFDSWKLWENYLFTAIQIKEYQTAIQALEKVWELKGNAFAMAQSVAEGKKPTDFLLPSGGSGEDGGPPGTLQTILDPEIVGHLTEAVRLNVAAYGRKDNFLLERFLRAIQKFIESGNFLYSPVIYYHFSQIFHLDHQWNEQMKQLELCHREMTGKSSYWQFSLENLSWTIRITKELGEFYRNFPQNGNLFAGKLLIQTYLKKVESYLEEKPEWKENVKESIQGLKDTLEKLKTTEAGGSAAPATAPAPSAASSYAASMGGSSSYLSDMWR